MDTKQRSDRANLAMTRFENPLSPPNSDRPCKIKELFLQPADDRNMHAHLSMVTQRVANGAIDLSGIIQRQ